MLSGSSKNVNLKVNARGCGIIDKSVSEVLGNFRRIYFHLMFTGIRGISRAGRFPLHSEMLRTCPGHRGTRPL